MDSDLETAKLLFEAVQIMVPILTGFLTIYAAGVGKLWDRLDVKLSRVDFIWVTVICLLAVISFGCWALTLAGAIVSTSGESGLTIPFSGKDALAAARISMGIGYWFFIFTLFSSGYYFLKLNIRLRDDRPGRPAAKAAG